MSVEFSSVGIEWSKVKWPGHGFRFAVVVKEEITIITLLVMQSANYTQRLYIAMARGLT